MNNPTKILVATAVFGAGVLLVGRVRAVGTMIRFMPGDPVSAADFNANFDELHDAIADLEGELVTVKADLTEARSVAGYTTLPDGSTAPFYRKVLQGTKSSTTTTIAHGVPDAPATHRRFLSCVVSTNNETEQTVPINTDTGASGTYWFDFDDTNLTISWVTATTMPYQVVLEYVKTPLD
jgi:hypothetical protein